MNKTIIQAVQKDDEHYYENMLKLLEDGLFHRTENTGFFVHTKDKEYELDNVVVRKEIDRNGFPQTVIILEVR